jgi:hypothetical protein
MVVRTDPALPLGVEQVLERFRRLVEGHHVDVEPRREHVHQQRGPHPVPVLEIGGEPIDVGRPVGRDQARARHRDHRIETVENVGLHPPGARLAQNLQRRRSVVGARILQPDPGIFFLEGILQRTNRLVHDQGRVPDHLAFLFRRLDQRGIRRPRGRRRREHGGGR